MTASRRQPLWQILLDRFGDSDAVGPALVGAFTAEVIAHAGRLDADLSLFHHELAFLSSSMVDVGQAEFQPILADAAAAAGWLRDIRSVLRNVASQLPVEGLDYHITTEEGGAA